jgi:hypothetical protein
MLVELDQENTPVGTTALVEVPIAYPEVTKLSRKETGRTVLVMSTAGEGVVSRCTAQIDLTYPEFRWALARSIKNGEPFLDLKQANLPQIKNDYAQSMAGAPPRPRGVPQDILDAGTRPKPR